MALSNLFVEKVHRKPERGATVATAAPVEGAVGVFITPKSLMSFPVASVVVTILWGLCKRLFPTWGSSDVLVLGLSLLVGAVIFLISTADPDAKPKAPREWFIAALIAAFNSLFLAASVLGILTKT